MTDKEAEDLLKTLRKFWSSWKYPKSLRGPLSWPDVSLHDLRGAFKSRKKDVTKAIRELEVEHREEAQELEQDPLMNEKFRRMKPSDRANLAVEMSSVVSTITLESILDRNPRISKARLLEEARKRFHSGRRTR